MKLPRFIARPLNWILERFETSPEKRAAKRQRQQERRLAKLERQMQKRDERRQREDEQFQTREGAATGSIFDHLSDFRLAVTRAAIAVLVFSAVSLIFAEQILLFLLAPYGNLLQVTDPTESVSIFIRVGLTMGLAISSPFIILEIIRFVAPGLRPSEARTLWLVVPGAMLLFILGAAFAWFVMLPAAINFLSSFLPNIFRVEWKANEYVPFVLSLTLWIGIAFEMPLVAWALAAVGVVTPILLWKGWRVAIVGAAVIAAAITPTVDPFNMMLVMGPLLALYGISILLTFIPYRRRQARLEYERLLEERRLRDLAERQAAEQATREAEAEPS